MLLLTQTIGSAAAQTSPYGNPIVTTVAGSGAAGMSDGRALQARFLRPSAVAIRPSDGAVFIADETAQRIREITPAHNVVTVAGSGNMAAGLQVHGGYRDGAATHARFNRPAGLAFASDGSLYIADSLNRCLRKLVRHAVMTVAGKCGRDNGSPRAIDGIASSARFLDPRALAFDSQGNLYIADGEAGLRRLSRSGIVSTIKLKHNANGELTHLTYGGGAHPVVVATSRAMAVSYNPSTGIDEVIPSESEGIRRVGSPNAVAAIDDRQILFTDEKANGINYLRLPAPPFVGTLYSRIIAGSPNGIAGYRDGPLLESRFNSPIGIAISGQAAYVADAGNRRIRKVMLPKFRTSETGLSAADSTDDRHYEVALVGASYVFYDSLGDDSMCAAIERTFNESGRFSKPVRCHTIRIDAAPVPKLASYIANFLTVERMDAIIMYVSVWQSPISMGLLHFYEMPPADGITAMRSALHEALDAVRPMHTSFALAWGYLAADVSDSESLVARERPSDSYPLSRTFTLPDESAHRTIGLYLSGLRDLPIMQTDLYDGLIGYEKNVDPLPLYEVDDLHFSARGNTYLGRLIAEGLLAQGFPRVGNATAALRPL
ncbi:MAG: hypothetical protein JO233_05900 [Candidatus Eremiobacteraeota bacterium]|nr:hypothetical protein [Candidatus Eremiobacteraeota bacterium]